MEDDSLVHEHREFRSRDEQGKKSTIVTVTGYHGFERFKLIRLIASTGAIYVGRMSRSVTHLICWKHEGQKYRLAKKFKVAIVNHHWIEECVKRGTIVSVDPYTFHSGEEIGPLSADVTSWMNQEKTQVKPSKKAKKLVINIDNEETDGFGRNDSIHIDEPQEESSSHPANFRRLRKRYSAPPEPQEKRRRLVKNCSNLDNWLSTSEKEQSETLSRRIRNSNRVGSMDSDIKECPDTSNRQGRFCNGQDDIDSSDAVEDIDGNNHENRAKHACHASTSAMTTCEKVTQAACEDLSTLGHDNCVPGSTQPSCVICLTDFSLTRGVLPCGHRFCFSCIQSWADYMASRNKSSTCPLCKASFICISRVEAAVTSDQKIFSQSVPEDGAKVDLFVLPEQTCNLPNSVSAAVCFRCLSREPEDLLIRCHFCQIRCVHSYCLDPPLFPWTCTHCKDLRMLYLHNL